MSDNQEVEKLSARVGSAMIQLGRKLVCPEAAGVAIACEQDVPKLFAELGKTKVQLAEERASREAAELAHNFRTAELQACHVKLAQQLAQCVNLKQQFHSEEARLNQSIRDLEATALGATGMGVARQVAKLECGPLQQTSPSWRSVLKKKLLLKWHPDRQPSREHAALATQVMQELQNRPEWHGEV